MTSINNFLKERNDFVRIWKVIWWKVVNNLFLNCGENTGWGRMNLVWNLGIPHPTVFAYTTESRKISCTDHTTSPASSWIPRRLRLQCPRPSVVPRGLLATNTYPSACVCTGHWHKFARREAAMGPHTLDTFCTHQKYSESALLDKLRFLSACHWLAFSYQRNPNFCRPGGLSCLTHFRLCLAEAQIGRSDGQTPHPNPREQ